jgi:hypothetical protein
LTIHTIVVTLTYIMTTLMQQLAIEKTVENGGNVTAAMREVGYAEATVNNPSNLTKSKGYMQRLEALGLTESLVTAALVEDIREKKGKRTAELALAAELLGMRKMGIVIANQITVQEQGMVQSDTFSDIDLEELADRMADEIRLART